MRFHEELNPKLWDGLILKEDVKEKLHEIADAFREYLDISEDSILDIRITGSSASYNYTQYSDLDLHFIVDFEKVHEDCPLVEGYLWSYKSQFNDNHDISIYGVPVELYAEDSRQEAISNGVYSLMEDKWLKEPKKIPPTDNDEDVQAKYLELKEACEKCDDSEEAEKLLTKIYTMRKAGLADVGEFSTENMAFKLLRNDGVIEKLKELKKEKVDKQLSLESYNESKEFKVGDRVRKGKRLGTIKKVDYPEKGYLDVEFDDGKDNGSYVKQSFRKVNETAEEPKKDLAVFSKALFNSVNHKPEKDFKKITDYKLSFEDAEKYINTDIGYDRPGIIYQIRDKQGNVLKEVKWEDVYNTEEELNNTTRYLYKYGSWDQIEYILKLANPGARQEQIDKKIAQLQALKDEQERRQHHMYYDGHTWTESYNESLETNNKELIKQRYINGDITAQEVQKLLPNLSSLETTSWALSKFNKENNVEDAFDKVVNENAQTFALAKKFNSPKEFKDSLINARDNYNVEDVVEGKDLLHLVYNHGKHIATYNNTTLELYYDQPNFKKVNEDMNKEIKINGHTYKASQNGSVINVRKIAKYDDADYYYAIYKPETAQLVYTQNGGKNKQSGVVKYKDMDKQLDEIAKHLDELNKSIKPNMVHEDVNSLEDKIDCTQKDMEQLKRQLQGCAKLTEDLNKLIEQALEIGDKVTVAHSGAVPRKGTITDIKGDVATVDFPAKDGTPARTDQYYTDELKKVEKLYGVEIFLDTVDGDPEPGLTEFNKESLIDYLNDFGYDLDMDCSDDELKEVCDDLEQPIKYIKESLDEDPTFADLLDRVEKASKDPLSALIIISDYYDMTVITSNLRHIKVAYDKGYNTAQHQHKVRDLAKELFNELEKGIGQDKVKQLKSNIVGI